MRYLISKRVGRAGLGDRIATLVQMWWIAVSSNRSLVIDWHNNPYKTKDNLFDILFKPMGVIRHPHRDVEIISGNIKNMKFPGPIDVAPKGYLVSKYAHSETPTIVTNEFIPNCSTFNNMYIPENILPFELCKTFFSNLRLRDRWCDRYKQFMESVTMPMIGVVIRHGNGEWHKNHRRYISDLDDYCMRISEKILYIPHNCVFLSTDSIEAVNMMRHHAPNIMWREHWLPPIGAGPMHLTASKLSSDPIEVAADGVINMYILSMCDNIIGNCDSKYMTTSASMNKSIMYCM